MKDISSSDNGIFKAALKLTRKKYRDEMGQYILEGVKALKDALALGIQVDRIFLDRALSEDLFTGNTWLEAVEDRLIVLESRLFERLSGTKTSQGVISIVHRKFFDAGQFAEAVSDDNVVVLDRLQDPGNMGTIIRTAEAAGYGGIMVLAGSADPYSPKVVRAAAGSILRMPILASSHAEDAVKQLHRLGKKIAVSCLDESAVNCFEADLSENIALIVGNEGQGVSQPFMELADIKIKIPMEPSIESLNAAVAAGILMYRSLGGKF